MEIRAVVFTVGDVKSDIWQVSNDGALVGYFDAAGEAFDPPSVHEMAILPGDLAKDTWLAGRIELSIRDLIKVIPPSAEEIAAEQDAAYQAVVAARDAAIDAAILASSAYRSFIRGDMTLTAYREAASDIEAQFPLPVR